ncbi:MAG: hypothetical protein AAGF12_14770 [Myxococcota bacterium]
MKRRLVSIVALIAPLAVGCPGSLDDPERFEAGARPDGSGMDATPSEGGMDAMTGCDIQAVMDTSCATTGCHNAMTMAASLDLSAAGDGSSYVGQAAAATGGSCADMGELIVAGQPDMGLMITKLEDTPTCGNRMPLVGSLSSEDRACIEEWARAAAGN